MPILQSNGYTPSYIFRNQHVNTIYPYLFRERPHLAFQRESIETTDGDFFEVDWVHSSGKDKLVVLLHGLEGSSQSQYILGTADLFRNTGYSVAAINFRSCGGTINRGKQLYHSGFTEDLEQFLSINRHAYDQIFLIGFSLGGSVVMNYLGRKYPIGNIKITAAAGISVPCDLLSGSIRLKKWYNYLYEQKFLSSLTQKIKNLSKINPEKFDTKNIHRIRSLMDFDNAYTAPIHGFADGLDYYETCSCLPVLKHLTVPTLLINALDDSFLTPKAFPYDIAENHNHLYLITPRYGGHVGFSSRGVSSYWNEIQVLDFFNRYSKH